MSDDLTPNPTSDAVHRAVQRYAELHPEIRQVADEFVAAGLYQRTDRQRLMLAAARGQY